MGNPLDPDVLFGPLADAEQLKKVMQYVEYGRMAFTLVVSDSIRMAQMAKATTSSRPSSRMRAMKCGLLRRNLVQC